jgi:hypothetical protein
MVHVSAVRADCPEAMRRKNYTHPGSALLNSSGPPLLTKQYDGSSHDYGDDGLRDAPAD